MEQLSEILREHHIKVTPQRLCVFEVLRDIPQHLSVEEVHHKVRKKIPSVSLATIYSALEYLKERGLLKEIKIDFERSLYEAREDEHHHFYCRRCKKTLDIDLPPCSALKKKEIQGHVVDEFQGYFYGICRKCRSKNKK